PLTVQPSFVPKRMARQDQECKMECCPFGYKATRKSGRFAMNCSMHLLMSEERSISNSRSSAVNSSNDLRARPPNDLGDDWLKNVATAPAFDLELNPVAGKSKCLHGSHRFDPSKVLQQAEEDWRYLG